MRRKHQDVKRGSKYGLETRVQVLHCSLLEWLGVLLQCTEASILVFAGCLWFDLPTHMYKNSPDQAAYICHLPLRQARSGLQRKCFRLACLLDVSCNTDETFFFLWKMMMEGLEVIPQTQSQCRNWDTGPDRVVVNSPLMRPRISRQKLSLQRVGSWQFVTQRQASDKF